MAAVTCGSFFSIDTKPIRKIRKHVGEPVEPPLRAMSPARESPLAGDALAQTHDDGDVFQIASDALAAIDIHRL